MISLDKAKVALKKTTLLTGPNTKANIDALDKASLNAEQLANSFDYLIKNTTLLMGENAQAYFDALITAGSNAEQVARAFSYFKDDSFFNLLISGGVKIYLDALVIAGPHAEQVALAIDHLKNTGFVMGEYAQTFIDGVCKAGPNAEALAKALTHFEAIDFLYTKYGQAYLDALIKAGSNAEQVAKALVRIHSPLQREENYQTFINILIEAGPNAEYVGHAFYYIQQNNPVLHRSFTNRVYIDAFISAGPNAELLAQSFDNLLRSNFSCHDRDGIIQQRYIDALVKAGPNANFLVSVIINMVKNPVSQSYLDALVASGKNAANLVEAFNYLKNTSLLTSAYGQTNIDAFVKAGDSIVGIKILLKAISENNASLLIQTNLDTILKLDGAKSENLAKALDVLRQKSLNLVTQTHFNILAHAENPHILVELLTGKIQTIADIEQAMKALSKDPYFSKYALKYRSLKKAGKETILEIILHLVQDDAFSIKIFERIIYLSDVELNLLKSAFEKRSSSLSDLKQNASPVDIKKYNHLLFSLSLNEYSSPVLLAIDMKSNVMAQFRRLSPSLQLDMPKPYDVESSMSDILVAQAKARFNLLKEKFGLSLQLQEVEKQIRQNLLEDIINEFNTENKNEAADFIRDNLTALVERRDETLIKKALSFITSNTSTAQIAWRAYEPLAPWQSFSNMLTPPTAKTAKLTVFSTSASREGLGEGAVTEETASNHVREFVALSFLASKDKILSVEDRKAIWADFKIYVSEIRRAHNFTSTEPDNPSCFPGCLTRASLIVSKHPLFKRKEETNSAEIPQIVDMKVKALVDALFNECCEDEKLTKADKALLYFSLILVDLNNADELIEKPEIVSTLLSAGSENAFVNKSEGLKSSYYQWIVDYFRATNTKKVEEEVHIKKAMELRAQFLQKLIDKDVLGTVNTHLQEKEITVSDEKLVYLITRSLARLQSLGVSLLKPDLVITSNKNDDSFEEELPFREPLALSVLEKFQSIRTPEQQARAAFLNHYIPTYQRTFYKVLGEVLPDLDQQTLIKMVKFMIPDDIENLDKLKGALSNDLGRNLAEEFKQDNDKISNALASVRKELEIVSNTGFAPQP